MRLISLTLPMAALMLGGCLAKTVVGVATAPFKVAGKAADLATTSQSEADEERGRELRQREARLGQLERGYQISLQRCEQGGQDACAKARADHAEIQRILPTVPVAPEYR